MKTIRAHVKRRWSDPRMKFQRSDLAKVTYTPESSRNGEPTALQRRLGEVGTVIAVTCARDGKIRGLMQDDRYSRRDFTRYYLRFADGEIHGFHSHYLSHLK